MSAEAVLPRVMVVDDEPMIRQLVCSVLTTFGYRALPAESAAQAAQFMDEHAPVDLLVTDVVMPEVSGCELARRMVARHPKLRVLFMSGYAPADCAHPEISASSFLRKPFDIADLREEVRSLLGR